MAVDPTSLSVCVSIGSFAPYLHTREVTRYLRSLRRVRVCSFARSNISSAALAACAAPAAGVCSCRCRRCVVACVVPHDGDDGDRKHPHSAPPSRGTHKISASPHNTARSGRRILVALESSLMALGSPQQGGAFERSGVLRPTPRVCRRRTGADELLVVAPNHPSVLFPLQTYQVSPPCITP